MSSSSPRLARKQAVPPPPKGSVVVGAIRVPGINGPSEELIPPNPVDAGNNDSPPETTTTKSTELTPDENDEGAGFDKDQPITVTATLAPSESQNEVNNRFDDDVESLESGVPINKKDTILTEQSTSSRSKTRCNSFTATIVISLLVLAGVAVALSLLLTKDDGDDNSSNASSTNEGGFVINDEVERRAQCPGIQRWRATPDNPCDANGQNCRCPPDVNGCNTSGDCPEISWAESPVNARGEEHPDYAASSNRARCPGLQRYSASPDPDAPCPVELGCNTANFCPEVAFEDVLEDFGS